MNSTAVNEDLFQSESGKGTYLDSEKTKIKKRRIKVSNFVGFVLVTV
jgi:hypothetical protein